MTIILGLFTIVVGITITRYGLKKFNSFAISLGLITLCIGLGVVFPLSI
jgi:hypothetical protein